AFLISLFTGTYFDRYYLALFPAALSLAARDFRLRWTSVGPALVFLGAWSVFGTWDMLASNEARWKGGAMLHAMNIPYEKISNGLDWESYYSYEKRMKDLKKARPNEEIRWADLWLGIPYRAVASFASRSLAPGRVRVGQVPYWCPLTWKTEY